MTLQGLGATVGATVPEIRLIEREPVDLGGQGSIPFASERSTDPLCDTTSQVRSYEHTSVEVMGPRSTLLIGDEWAGQRRNSSVARLVGSNRGSNGCGRLWTSAHDASKVKTLSICRATDRQMQRHGRAVACRSALGRPRREGLAQHRTHLAAPGGG